MTDSYDYAAERAEASRNDASSKYDDRPDLADVIDDRPVPSMHRHDCLCLPCRNTREAIRKWLGDPA